MSLPEPELLRSINRERVERSRRMHPIEKIMRSAELYDMTAEWRVLGQIIMEQRARERRSAVEGSERAGNADGAAA